MQLIVTSMLSEEDNFWLKNLTNDLRRKEEADRLFEEYEKNSNSNLHKSIMDLVVRANKEVFEEASGNMCDALRELFSKEIDEAVTEGSKAKLIELITKKLAKGKSVEQIADELEETVETIQELMKTLN